MFYTQVRLDSLWTWWLCMKRQRWSPGMFKAVIYCRPVCCFPGLPMCFCCWHSGPVSSWAIGCRAAIKPLGTDRLHTDTVCVLSQKNAILTAGHLMKENLFLLCTKKCIIIKQRKKPLQKCRQTCKQPFWNSQLHGCWQYHLYFLKMSCQWLVSSIQKALW